MFLRPDDSSPVSDRSSTQWRDPFVLFEDIAAMGIIMD
jgi:hypothetical protein